MRILLRATGVVVIAALAAGCRERERTTAVRADPARCAALQPVDSAPTSRAAFLHEVLDGRPTSRTAKFDDYHEGSYHVAKADLADGLLDVARACGLPLAGVVVVGPTGPLWAYHVAAFLREPDGRVRVNSLVMPHARITGKATGVVPASAVDSLFGGLAGSPLLNGGAVPLAAQQDTSPLARDFRYDVLVLRVVGGSVELRSGALRGASDTVAVRRLLERVNAVLERLQPTYPAEHDRDAPRGDT